MTFAARPPTDPDARRDKVATLEEYRPRRDLTQVLQLADDTARDHRSLLYRLGDA